MKLVAIDSDPGAKAVPVVAHNLELSCDGLQLARRCVANFYCEFFHWMVGLFSGRAASFIVRISFFTSRRISSRASAILFNCFVSIYSFLNVSYHLWDQLSSLKLAAWSLTPDPSTSNCLTLRRLMDLGSSLIKPI